MTLTSADAARIAVETVANSNAMSGTPGGAQVQVGLMQAAAGFTIAAAVLDLAAVIRERSAQA